MRSLPPWRLAPGGGFLWLIAAFLFLYVWIFELEIWLTVWFCYAVFLGARWIWRHNPIGQTVDSASAARARRDALPDASASYIDLGNLDR